MHEVAPILLVDLSALFWRYWHSTNSGPQAYEFTIDHLTELVRVYPRMVICCEGTRPIRFEWFADYKKTRPAKPEGAKESLRQIITELEETPGVPVVRVDYCEADDVIATLASQANNIGIPIRILSRDKDLYALIDTDVRLLIDDKEIDRAACFEKFGVYPLQIRDYLAIVGDASDNVPGCPGIGAKGASALLQRFGNLPAACAATDEDLAILLKPKQLEKFRAWDPSLAVKLVTLIYDAPINITQLFPNESDNDMADMTKITTERKNGPLKIVCYGPEGVGKTRFGAFSTKPIFLCAENGLSAPDLKDTPAFPSPENWADVLAAIDHLKTTDHGYRTLVVDSLDWLYQHVKADIQRRENMTAASYEDYGRGDKFTLDHWVKLTQAFDDLQATKGMHIIVLAHSGMEVFQNPQGEDFNRFQLALSKKAAERWKQWPDFLLFMSQELFTKKKEDKASKGHQGVIGGHRIFTERAAAFDAKNRVNLPAEIEYETANPWRSFAQAVKETMAPAVKSPAKVEAEQPKASTEAA